jgi:predicted nucleotidyltransferase component of viral defense system
MAADYLHNHKDFAILLGIVGRQNNILPGLIEKDYWIMHVLNGLKKEGFNFELKGGTSLSKGYKIINRFSEDIDIHIKPPPVLNVEENPKKNKSSHIESRKKFYDWLAHEIKIDGIDSVTRDHAFDNERFTSGGIRLHYNSKTPAIEGVKEGILLEAGFDTVTPNTSLTISSWALDHAKASSVDVIDNLAVAIACYDPGYTFVEKLQTIVRKFWQEQNDQIQRPNLLRQYYDVYCLLGQESVQQFIGTPEYMAHKKLRFSNKDSEIPIAQNDAFLIESPTLRKSFSDRYKKTANLYYKGQPDFDEVLNTIKVNIDKL